MKCDSHYPIIGNWDVIQEDGNSTTYQCPRCKETYTVATHHGPLDMVPDEMKEARKQYADEQVQPYRQGQLSREFVNLHPDKVKGMVKSGIVTKQQVKQSKHVWKNDLKGLSARATS